MDEKELSPALREAYREATATTEPSPLLWRRTRRSLEAAGLLRGRRSSWARSSWIKIAAVAAAAAFIGFLSGFAAGWRAAPVEAAALPTVAADSTSSVERVQRLGTDYARAVEDLARSMERGTATEISTAQQVLIALSSAHAELLGTLVPAEVGPGAPAAGGAGASAGGPEAPIIWF